MFVFVSPCTWLRPSVPTLYNEWARLFSVLFFFFLLSLVCFIFTPLQLRAAGRPAGNVDGGYTKPRYRRGKKKFLQVTFLSLLLKDNLFFKPSSPHKIIPCCWYPNSFMRQEAIPGRQLHKRSANAFLH